MPEPTPVVQFENPLGINGAVGMALHRHRVAAGLAIRELGRASGVSSAMISRIENGQVSPSLSTLESLARALAIPVVSFFQHTIQTADITFARAGEGLTSKRFAPGHVHDYTMLGDFSNNELKFSAVRVTLRAEDDGSHPVYFSRGYVFLTILDGGCIYSCGDTDFEMHPGDSLTFDAQLRHGAKSVIGGSVSFLTIRATPA